MTQFNFRGGVSAGFSAPFSGESQFAGQSLYFSRGFNHLIKNFSFSLKQGESLHIQGKNGVGKTTLLRALSTLSHADSGVILWGDEDVRNDLDAFRSQLCFLGHKPGLYQNLSARENLKFFCRINCPPNNPTNRPPNNRQHEEEIDTCLQQLGLECFGNLPCQQLSAGQKHRVAIARLWMSGKRLWILDEPANTLDDKGIEFLQQLLTTQVNQGGIVVFTSHQKLSLQGHGQQSIELL